MTKMLALFSLGFLMACASSPKSEDRFPASSRGLTEQDVMPGSIANISQLEILRDVVRSEIKGNRSDRESVAVMNKSLVAQGLPPITYGSRDYNLKGTSINGFAGSTPIGVEIIDGQYKYCLPCTIGWNSFQYGILKYEIKH